MKELSEAGRNSAVATHRLFIWSANSGELLMTSLKRSLDTTMAFFLSAALITNLRLIKCMTYNSPEGDSLLHNSQIIVVPPPVDLYDVATLHHFVINIPVLHVRSGHGEGYNVLVAAFLEISIIIICGVMSKQQLKI